MLPRLYPSVWIWTLGAGGLQNPQTREEGSPYIWHTGRAIWQCNSCNLGVQVPILVMTVVTTWCVCPQTTEDQHATEHAWAKNGR